MKKKILLVIILLIGLTGCSSSKESMLEKSQKISVDELGEELNSNFKKAKDKYEKNIYEISAGVISVEDKYAKLELSDVAFYDKQYIEAYFNEKDLKKLKTGQRINFVGKISNISKKDNNINIKMKKAYYISDVLEIIGSFKRHESTHYEYIYFPTHKSKIICTDFNFSFYEEANEYIEYNFDDILDTDEPYLYINDIRIEDGDNVTMEIKAIREMYRDEENNIEAEDEWTITEILSIKVNK